MRILTNPGLPLTSTGCIRGGPTDADAPYIETFCHHGKTLVYVAASHYSAVQYPHALQDPVCKTILYAFSEVPPDAVIVERIDPSELPGFRVMREIPFVKTRAVGWQSGCSRGDTQDVLSHLVCAERRDSGL